MGHCISGAILPGPFDETIAEKYDLYGVKLGFDLTLFHFDHYYTACLQTMEEGLAGCLPMTGHTGPILPNEVIVAVLMERITGNTDVLFAVIATDYFGGTGDQLAQVYRGRKLADEKIFMISPALKYLGVTAARGLDEFDTVGLDRIRSGPEWLEKYQDLAEKLDV